MDKLTKQKRSWNMSRIRGRDTRPELAVRSLLHRLGYRFRLNRSALPGKPDAVLPGRRTAVFVHGCFWHRHPGCRFAYTPKSRVAFWNRKFENNMERDAKVTAELNTLKWRQLVIWECELKDVPQLTKRIEGFFND